MSVPLLWIGLLLVYHSIEFGFHIYFQQTSVSLSDFYLDSKYCLFLLISLLECKFSGKHQTSLLIGIILFVFGALIRLASICQLKKQFTLRIGRRSNVNLVQTGLYSIVRHPGYCGFWFIIIGSQLMLGNVICLVVGIVLMKRYFESRIYFEESLLAKQADYAEYKRRVRHVGIPFVNIL